MYSFCLLLLGCKKQIFSLNENFKTFTKKRKDVLNYVIYSVPCLGQEKFLLLIVL
jgi:hypothetical protein